MQSYALRHLSNEALLRDLSAIVQHDRNTTASLLAHLAEVDRRRLYADAGYRSMFDYCVGQFDFSEDMAGRRITAARVARRFPKIFEAIADGRIHVSALCLLSRTLKRLQDGPAAELLACAEHKSNDEIRTLLAERFPQPDLAPHIRPLMAAPASECVLSPHAPARVEVQELSGNLLEGAPAPAAVTPQPAARGRVDAGPSGRLAPLSPGRFGLQLTMSAETREKLQRAQDLLAPAVPRNDLAQLLDRALEALIEKVERRRFGATDAPRAAGRSVRHIPSSVRRAVCARDGGQCTFESDHGRRCEERADLEFDHVVPVAKGGETTVANLRLRCHAHNQLEAERVFGAGFMEAKRAQAGGVRRIRSAEHWSIVSRTANDLPSC